jgi:5-amino-6-(5-phosphoribosylamino)uracil reductase
VSGASLPHLRLVLAISLDGRLAPPEGGDASIGGRGDRRVLEEALAWSDGALLGAETLRLHGSTCLIHAPDLLEGRTQRGRSPQPLALVASRSGRLPAGLPFFSQPVERWLLLAQDRGQAAVGEALPALPSASPAADRVAPLAPVDGARSAAHAHGEQAAAPPAGFARVIPMRGWEPALRQLAAAGLQRLVVLGGAALAASLLAENRLDELQLTLCPKLLGGEHTWLGLSALVPVPARTGWRLLEQRRLEGEELLLRYGRVLG